MNEYNPTREQLIAQLAYAVAEGKDIEAASLRREIAATDAPPYCPCAGQCHHSPNPCSFGCLMAETKHQVEP